MFWRMPDVLCAYHLATVHLTRLSRAWRAQAHCFHALCVLRVRLNALFLRNHPTSDHKLRRLFFQCQRFRRTTCSKHESVETVRSTPRTGLNRVNCTRRARRKSPWGKLVGRSHVSPPNPRIKSQNPKGGFGALWRVFLRYLSSRKERYRHRRSPVKQRGW